MIRFPMNRSATAPPSLTQTPPNSSRDFPPRIFDGATQPFALLGIVDIKVNVDTKVNRLRSSLAELEKVGEVARRELERDRYALLEHAATTMPEDLDALSGRSETGSTGCRALRPSLWRTGTIGCKERLYWRPIVWATIDAYLVAKCNNARCALR
jgi:hypothetical protein